jgi:hypothetical protein
MFARVYHAIVVVGTRAEDESGLVCLDLFVSRTSPPVLEDRARIRASKKHFAPPPATLSISESIPGETKAGNVYARSSGIATYPAIPVKGVECPVASPSSK